MAHKINFTSKNVKALRIKANDEFSGMNHAIKAVLAVWDNGTTDNELQTAIDAIKADGCDKGVFSAAFIIEHLDGTNFCQNKVIGTTTKGEFKARTRWNAGQVVDYVRRANRARIIAMNKAEKSAK